MITLRHAVADGQTRLYLDGLARPGIYLWFDPMDARVRWSSPANDRPYALRTTAHHLDISADADAAYEAAARLGIDMRAQGAWEKLLGLAGVCLAAE